jgi:hypothetical protein
MIATKDPGTGKRCSRRGFARAALMLTTGMSMELAGIASAAVANVSGTSSAFVGAESTVSAAQPGLHGDTQAGLAAAYGRLPLRFEPNVGQAPSAVKYLARADGYSVGLTESGVLINLMQKKAGKPAGKKSATVTHAQLRLSLDRARIQPGLRAERRQGSVSNYFIGSDRARWHNHVANYGAVRYIDVYPGIDWTLYGNPQQLEYDFVIAAHTDPQRIRLNIEGAEHLSLDGNGDLLIEAAGRTLRQFKPVIYQTTDDGARQTVAGHYVVDEARRQIAFSIGDYDPSRALVIDPVLAYSTRLGGSGYDQANAVAVDAEGHAYVAGYTLSTDFPIARPGQAVNAGADDAFVAKLSRDGSTLIYSTYLGGSNSDEASAIAVDGTGNAYITGLTDSTDFPTSAPLQAANAGSGDVFIVKLNRTGTALLYSTYLGGDSPDEANAIAVDRRGDAYVAGNTRSNDFPLVQPLQAALAGSEDAFVAKLNRRGSALVYSTYLGGSDADEANALAIDWAGNAYVAGQTDSADFPTVGPIQASNAGNGDAFVTKLNSSGSALKYSSYLGGGGSDVAYGIAVDMTGNAYVVGETSSADFPTARALQSALSGDVDAFVAKLDRKGRALAYSTYLGGNGSDTATAIAVDAAGEAYVAGRTGSVDFPTPGGLQLAFAGGVYDAFVSRFDRNGGALLYSTYLGGSNPDIATAIAVDRGGNAYAAGVSASIDFPAGRPGSAAAAGVYSYDAFVTKLSPY